MMRNILLLILIVCFLGCKKDGPATRQAMQYEIAGLPDTITIESKDTVELPISINYIAGDKEVVTLQVSGLPAQTGAGFSTYIDTPAFTTTLRILSSFADTGIYTIQVIAGSSKSSVKERFILHILPKTVTPASLLAGTYTETGACLTGSQNHTVNITEDQQTSNRIRIAGLGNGNMNTVILADIDPSTQTLSIPSQPASSVTYQGNGSYTGSQIIIHYSMDYGFGKDSCNVTLNK